MDTPALTVDQIRALRDIEHGADVWAHGVASTLREIERLHPQLLKIVKAKNAPKDGAQRQPYFGAIATAAGRSALNDYGAAVLRPGEE